MQKVLEDWIFIKVLTFSIHGSIEVPAVAVAVIDTPQFQRLRDIKVLRLTLHFSLMTLFTN